MAKDDKIDEKTSEELDRYFNSKKFYWIIGLIIIGVAVVLIVYHKVKSQYLS